MTKRYYISAVSMVPSGDGFEAVLDAEQIDGVNVVAAEVAIAPDGTLIQPWALCVIEAANHSALNGRSGIYSMPVFPLDAKVASMQTQTKTEMVNAFKARGIPTDWINSTDGFREVLRGLGRLTNPGFNEDAGSWAI